MGETPKTALSRFDGNQQQRDAKQSFASRRLDDEHAAKCPPLWAFALSRMCALHRFFYSQFINTEIKNARSLQAFLP
ncbi:MAG: hypothetical protein AAF383_03855 [Cyanobacteria bacterium P01_A01_bin.83]